jgi:hypothetical protein
MDIVHLKENIRTASYRFSEHAIKQMIKRRIDRHEIEETIFEGEIIEEYPDDKYSASCLILGKTRAGRELHVQASLPPLVVIVTVYEPDSEEWIEGKIRR